MANSSKLQRWTDLLAALLRRHYPAPFEELAPDVPAYSDGKKSFATLMRMFERDKDELRSFGIPIETVINADDEVVGYKLSTKNFYLPYILLTQQGKKPTKPRRSDRYGYQALASLAFEPAELEAIASAASRVANLGDPILRGNAESAMRKLSFDLPVGSAAAASDPTTLLAARAQPSPEVLEGLNDALLRRKQVSFTYYSIGSGETTKRTAEPYGLFFVSSHWYIAARDTGQDGLRNFRVSRIADLVVNPARPQSPDFDVPKDFDLREHARSRHAWEIGDGDGVQALVTFNRKTGQTLSAEKLGEPVSGKTDARHFRVRRTDAFARWLLSFGGDASPAEPKTLVDEFQRQASETLALYGGKGNG